ncbi:unnamed protein product [Diatraea saccharalis]|uniref:Uncharacterized protein n=1 Tax=Diatraea saccharalis TaxID=40085 RepID=A0A9N9QTW2_9NEOP|nr:unnamed protein product [Diatraea saccharalis]
MISNNEDISAELDKVVCRLTKLALRTARRRQQPLSNRWMQCKLLDLLNLTEKAIGKKRQLYTEMNPLKAICYEKANASEESRELSYDVMEDDLANVFLDQTSSTELNFEEMIRFPSLIDIEPISPVHSPKHYSKVIPLSCLKAWADGNDKVLVYSVQNSSHCISSGDTDHSACNITAFRNQKNNKKRRGSAGRKPDLDLRHRIKTPSKTSYGKRRGNRKSNGHHDNNESVEQNVKKKPSYNILDKNSHQRLSAADVKKYLYKGKKSYKHMLQSRSRPISPTLIQFCHPNTENERDSALKESSTDLIELAPNNIDDTIAITKESLLIDIITEDNEETIALRRTIGTDAEDDLLIFENEQEHTRGSMTNVMNIDSFNDKPINGSEEIHSQTLFLYDINEPSTSKGIRHVSMDVQCGPESDNNYAMLSSTTSFTKRPQIFNAGLKIVNSFSDEQEHVINCDFGTSTNENFDSCKEISAKRKFTGIKIKDSETKITNKVETVTQETNTNLNISSILNLVSTTETRILESVSSHYKIEDSGSELCDSLSSSQRSPLHFMNFAKDTSGFPIKLTEDVELESKFSHKLIRPKLSNGGVYVHSYKERQMSEDVVYQGDWQRYTTVAAPKKKSCNVVTNRTLELNKRIRNDNKDNACTNKNIRPATVNLVRNNNVKNVKQVKKMPTVNNMAKVTSCNKNATKVASKLTSKRLLSKKSSTIIKKPPKTPTMLKTESEVMPKPRRKSYIPLYLKRKLSTNNHQNEHLDCGEQNKNEKVIVNKKVERSVNEIKTVLLKFNPEPNESVNYVVFKNEIETNNHCSTDSENIFNSDNDDERTNDSNKRSPSPQSFNSSAGSSPNSIATVRVRPTLRLADKRHSNSSNRSNQGLFQTENTEIINKKLTKKCKSVKKYQNNISDNKENLPESSKRNKDIAFSSTFSKNKSIFRAQIASENPQSANNIVNRRKSTNKANIKIPSVPSFTGKHSISGTSTMPSLSPENKSLKDSFNTKKAVNSMIQDSEIEQNSVIINIVDNNLLTEWMTTTQTLIAESQSSNIASAMRQLVEERLEFIERLSDNDAEADSRTVQMSERCNSVPASDTTSFHDATSLNSSYGTVMGFNDYTQIVDWNEMDLDNIFFDSVVYNEYDPAVDNDSIIGITGTKPNVTDLELLSFNSIASASKVSEYFLAEGSSNNDSDIQNSVTPADNCVRDIFERKAPLSIESPAGRLTIQAFSGLSMNAAPAARVLQDHVNLVDSETGSIARDHVRQTTSEEVFVSGRSSGSFDSCVINEDAVVPDWLFRIISQQQALEEDEDENDDEDEDEEEESEHLIPIQLPLAEPIYDVNGNAVEPGMGAGAGAGDGRGIHSDHSQDSSGRGTSLSSSVTSSGPQSEAILIDPTAFTMPYDLIREPASSSSIIVSQLPTHFEAADTSRATAEGPMNSRNAAILNSSGDPQILPVRAASDIDADISSIDTDVPDSSDN